MFVFVHRSQKWKETHPTHIRSYWPYSNQDSCEKKTWQSFLCHLSESWMPFQETHWVRDYYKDRKSFFSHFCWLNCNGTCFHTAVSAWKESERKHRLGIFYEVHLCKKNSSRSVPKTIPSFFCFQIFIPLLNKRMSEKKIFVHSVFGRRACSCFFKLFLASDHTLSFGDNLSNLSKAPIQDLSQWKRPNLWVWNIGPFVWEQL